MGEQQDIPIPREVGEVDLLKERKAHEFRTGKRADSPHIRAVLQVIRDDTSIWKDVEQVISRQVDFERNTSEPGETHRIGAGLFAGIYLNPEAAALYDVALYDATQTESDFFRGKIERGINYSPVTIVGGGGVYGTIFSGAALKENPDSPPFGIDAGRRRGGIWATSGDVTLDKEWWLMNSRNRPEDRNKEPIPGGGGNLNSLGSDSQNLQLPDVSTRQYPAQNELGRILEHDNFNSDNLVVNSRFIKARLNSDPKQSGKFQGEYEDANGRRFFTYTDVIVQATGLGREDLGFSPNFSSTREVLEDVQKDLKEGVKTPRLLTFLQLVEATTSNRTDFPRQEFAEFGLVGTGDTSRVIREYFIGAGVKDGKSTAQLDFVQEVVVFGLPEKTRDELIKKERARYVAGFLEFERADGGYFRFRPVDGKVVGVGIPKDGKGVVVYYKRIDETPEGSVVTYGKEIVPRLVTSAGFIDESDRIYSGLTADVYEDKKQITDKLNNLIPGTTIYFDEQNPAYRANKISRIDIDAVSEDDRVVDLTIIDLDGATVKKRLDRVDLKPEESSLLDAQYISKLEVGGVPPKFEAFFNEDFDAEIPVAEKAEGFEVFKIGACTNLPITEKERRQTKAYEKVPQNSRSIFRFVRRTVAFAKKIARQTPRVEGALNLQRYQARPVELLSQVDTENPKDLLVIPVDPKANAQKFPDVLKTGNLLKYLALSRLDNIFPEGLVGINFAVKRVKASDEKSPFGLAFEFNPPLPNGKDWEVVEEFLRDPLTQRLLINLTGKSTESAEVAIGIDRRRVDIRNTFAKSVKNSESSKFNDKYEKIVTLE